RGIEQATQAVVEAIRGMAKAVESHEAVAQVASISADDQEIGKLIADAMDKVGRDGVITVEESNTVGMTVEIVEGMQFDRGYLSPSFVTDTERMECVLENPYILIRDSKISTVTELIPILEQVAQAGRPLLII